MPVYTIQLSETARKSLKKIHSNSLGKIIAAIDELATTPFPAGVKKLKGRENEYRRRVGDYRIIYSVQNQLLIILILDVGNRKDIYK